MKYLTWLTILLCVSSANSSGSAPIAEYCVGYCDEKTVFSKGDLIEDCDSINVYLRLEKILKKQPIIANCKSDSIDNRKFDFDWTHEFLIHNDLKADQERPVFGVFPSTSSGFTFCVDCGEPSFKVGTYFWNADWYFYYIVPIYARDTASVDLNKYSKYYKKGKIIPVKWKLHAKCNSLLMTYDTTYSGSYFVRITGKCL